MSDTGLRVIESESEVTGVSVWLQGYLDDCRVWVIEVTKEKQYNTKSVRV